MIILSRALSFFLFRVRSCPFAATTATIEPTPWTVKIETDFWSQLHTVFCFKKIFIVYIRAIVLKLCQNKEGQTFVGMLVFLNLFFFNFNQLPAAKIEFKKRASQQTFGPFYFVRSLRWTFFSCNPKIPSFYDWEGLHMKKGSMIG